MGNHLPKHWGTFDFPTFDLRLYFLSFPMIKNHISVFSGVVAKMQVISACHRLLPSTFRLSTLRLIFIFNFSLLIINCGLDVEDPAYPSPPVWVQKSLPEEWPERGIDAHESGGIFLEWLPNPSAENVKSYLVFRSEYFEVQDSMGDYELLLDVETEAENIGGYIDRATSTNSRYSYFLVAQDDAENQSTSSDTLSYIRFSAIGSERMLPNGMSTPLETNRKLQWRYYYIVVMENYTVTILNIENELMLRRELTPANFTDGTESFTIPDTLVLLSGNVYKWRVDMGAQYVSGRETAGSESAWATFLYVAL